MEREGQGSSGEPSQAAEEEQSRISTNHIPQTLGVTDTRAGSWIHAYTFAKS